MLFPKKAFRYRRIFTIILDAVGVGDAPDAEKFDNVGADTLGSITAFYKGNLHLPHLQSLGLGNIRENKPLPGILPLKHPRGAYGKMLITSNGNDSIDGHWEMMDYPVRFDMDLFPDGFPAHLVEKLEQFSGRPMLVNKVYSGTEVLRAYGEQAVAEKAVILYTSGDSVLQLAAHTDVVPLSELYQLSEYARSLVNGPDITMGRVIARPFIGHSNTTFQRTAERRDYCLAPTKPTVLTRLQDAGYDVLAIGKIQDLFSGKGISKSWHNESNMDGMDHVDEALATSFCGLCLVNLVDFDTLYGHRRDPLLEGKALKEFDERLGYVLTHLAEDDLLMIAADHGNDPCYKVTDHTREKVPLLAYSPSMKHPGKNLGTRKTAADLGATILENFIGTEKTHGTSFLPPVS